MSTRQPGSADGGAGPAANPGGKTPDGGIRIVRAQGDLLRQALGRIAGADPGASRGVAERMLAHARTHKIDLTNAWAALDQASRVLDACLVVPGSGRTAMVFLSNGPDRPAMPDSRVDLARAAADWLTNWRDDGGEQVITLAQALLEDADAPDGTGGAGAGKEQVLLDAGFIGVGQLAYMRRPLMEPSAQEAFPEDVSVSSLRGASVAEIDEVLAPVLEASYEQTLDCPELCGLRRTSDVLASHRGVGRFDPALWSVLSDETGAIGCLLLNECPDQGAYEVVYLGLAPRARGRGLARRLLAHGIAHACGRKRLPIMLAVDLRNAPALSLYGRAGFEQIGARTALVRALATRPE